MTRYLGLYENVKRKIIDGVYPFGSKLPSKRVTAEENGVSVITVEHAYELLQEEGYISAKEKSGYFVTYKESDSFETTGAKTPQNNRNIYRHTKNNTGVTHDEEISFNIYAKTARKVLSEYGEEITDRSPGYGCESLRRAIKDYLYRYRGIDADSDRIIVGAGAEYLYGLIINALGRGAKYAGEYPSYEKIYKIYEAEEVKLELLNLGDDGIESEFLWNTQAKVLHITPYRSFPTGVTASAAKKAEYLRWSVEKKGIIIEDDFESEFTPSRKAEETLFSLDKNDRVIYVNTFTRTVGPFIRAAYMVIPKRLKALFDEKTGFYACTVPVLEQYILTELIENGDFVRHINRVRRKRREERKLL
ncbi:MAG: PLP-dependent aminotransferase family protein [Lachnospiraceae bacterium]|nr:PLP-dependent aminotransferase family protein [Lachnospiraceae bacterium]